MGRQRMGRLTVVVALAVALLASSPAAAAAVGVVRFNVGADPASFDPLAIHRDAVSAELELLRLAYEPFVEFDERGRPQPVLLARIPSRANGDLSADGRTIRYRLRRGVRWSDGSPVTSRDVVASFARLRREAPATSGYRLVAAVRPLDAATVEVRLRRPWSPAVWTFFSYGEYPAFVAPARGGGRADGPFRLAAWRRGEELRFVPNPYYWRGRPGVAEIRAQIVASSQTNELMLRSGAVDWGVVPPAAARTLRAAGLRVRSVPTTTVGVLAMNLSGVLHDRRVRQAIARAIDRHALAARVGLGAYPELETLQPRRSPWRDPRVRQPAFDPLGAARLFDAAGYGPQKRRLALRLAYLAQSRSAGQLATLLQAGLAPYGVEIEMLPVTAATFYDPRANGVLAGRRYDLAYVSWPMSADGDDASLVRCGGGENFTGYCSRDVDALEARSQSSLDPAVRRRAVARVERDIARDLPFLVLLENDYLYATQPALRGFMPNGFVPTWNAYRWRR